MSNHIVKERIEVFSQWIQRKCHIINIILIVSVLLSPITIWYDYFFYMSNTIAWIPKDQTPFRKVSWTRAQCHCTEELSSADLLINFLTKTWFRNVGSSNKNWLKPNLSVLIPQHWCRDYLHWNGEGCRAQIWLKMVPQEYWPKFYNRCQPEAGAVLLHSWNVLVPGMGTVRGRLVWVVQ